MFSGFFDENFPGNAADLSFKEHSFSSNHGEVSTSFASISVLVTIYQIYEQERGTQDQLNFSRATTTG